MSTSTSDVILRGAGGAIATTGAGVLGSGRLLVRGLTGMIRALKGRRPGCKNRAEWKPLLRIHTLRRSILLASDGFAARYDRADFTRASNALSNRNGKLKVSDSTQGRFIGPIATSCPGFRFRKQYSSRVSRFSALECLVLTSFNHIDQHTFYSSSVASDASRGFSFVGIGLNVAALE
jgi:hypothetical protein